MHYNPGRRWEPRNRAVGVNRATVHGDVKPRERRSLPCLSSPWSDPRNNAWDISHLPKWIATCDDKLVDQRESVNHNNDDDVYKNICRCTKVFPIHLSQRYLAGFIEALNYMSRMKNLKNNFSHDKLLVTVLPFIENETPSHVATIYNILVIKHVYFNYLFLKETSISYNIKAKPGGMSVACPW